MTPDIKKTLRNLLKNSTLMIGSSIVSLLILELVTHIFYPLPPLEMNEFRLSSSGYYQKDAELGWIPRKNIRGVHNRKGSFSTTFRTNSNGFRDKEYELEKPKDVTRIIVIGDSFTWGYGVNDDEIYTERLETMLPKTEVINLGVTAYGLQQEILHFKREGLKYAPDIVILGFCLNDIYRNHEEIDQRIAIVNSNNNKREVTPFVKFKQYLFHKSALYRFIIDRTNSNKALLKALVYLGIKDSLSGFEELDTNLMPALREYPKSLEESWKETKSELLHLKQLTSDLRIRLVVAIIPSVQTIQPKKFEHSIAYTVFDREDFDLDRPYRLLEVFAKEQLIELVNPVKRFQQMANKGSLLYLENDMHFNANGHDLFAQAIAEYLSN